MTITTIHGDYAECLKQIVKKDPVHCASVLDLKQDGNSLIVPFYDRVYRIASGRIRDLHGEEPTEAVGLVLCRYILNCPSQPQPQGRPITFRELEGAGPLVSSFVTNTNKLITGAFAADVKGLAAAGERLNGQRVTGHDNYDLYMAFNALPRIRVYLQFNAADDMFPAQCGLLFDQCAETYLDMKSLFILGTYLAGGLVRYQGLSAENQTS